jgi:hypothetical protein
VGVEQDREALLANLTGEAMPGEAETVVEFVVGPGNFAPKQEFPPRQEFPKLGLLDIGEAVCAWDTCEKKAHAYYGAKWTPLCIQHAIVSGFEVPYTRVGENGSEILTSADDVRQAIVTDFLGSALLMSRFRYGHGWDEEGGLWAPWGKVEGPDFFVRKAARDWVDMNAMRVQMAKNLPYGGF